MTPFTTVVGAAVPLLMDNVDTDVVIRIERLTALSKHELGPYAFEVLRHDADGRVNAHSPFDQAQFKQAPILLTGPNFGCGSSREGAVWALQGLGIRCVIAPSFGDIFYSNCFQNGVLPLRLPYDVVKRLAAQTSDGQEMTVDLTACTVTAPNGDALSFEVEAPRRRALLLGLDDIGMTLQQDGVIRAWQNNDRMRRPWVWSI